MDNHTIFINQLDAIIFDFDGVLTNNLVYLDQDGKELVACHRGDGLAFDVFRKLKIKVYILSTEKNPVVTARATKLQVPVIQGVGNKVEILGRMAKEKDFKFSKSLYIGNDLNDLGAMVKCGFSACPADSHEQIKEVANIILKTNGGEGVAREIVEDVLQININELLYKQEDDK